MSNEEIQNNIVQTLREKYKPAAILLHGSRAVGKERPHSDWDIIMLFTEDIPNTLRRGSREEIMGQDVEYKAILIPVEEKKIFDTFGTKLQFAKILYEVDGKGVETLEIAHKFYAKGPNFSDDDIRKWKQFLEHKLLMMMDDIGSPHMFLRHLSAFFQLSSNLWFEVLHNEFSKPFYLAVPDIQARDQQFAVFLDVLASSSLNQEKIEAGKKIVERLFGEFKSYE